jgi:hypothetical protein
VPAGPPPVLVSDAARNPNWYSLIYDRGDVKVTVTGDLNFQEVPDAARLPDAPAEQFVLASEDEPSEPVSAQAVLSIVSPEYLTLSTFFASRRQLTSSVALNSSFET